MKYFFISSGLALLLVACAPKAVVHSTANQVHTPTSAQEAFLVLPEDAPFTGDAQELGDIHIKDSGLTLSCSYETAVAMATAQARQLGANVLRIYEHRAPDAFNSTCHRIRAKALRVADITPYEREITWSPNRRLQQADFKASIANRPFEAATSSGFRYQYAGRLLQGKVQLTVETYFDCQNSYFKGTDASSPAQTLAHEQGHFDITEIGARRFTKLLQEQAANTKELTSKESGLYHQVMTETQQLQDHYDSEVYADPSKQAAWLARIEQELRALQAYADKQLTIKIKV